MSLPALTPEDIQRYHRHLIIPEVGSAGQRKLKAAKVLLIGAGGLGSPASLYLAAAGVGTIGLVDFDVVDVSNLQRQIVHSTRNIGRSKIASARERLLDLNPLVNVIGHEEPLTSDNAFRIFEPYDIIVNGCDNFPTRYLANDAAVLLKKPLVDGSIFRFEGQANVYLPGQGCYRCLYPAPPPPGAVPSCAEAGVLGILPGMIGVLQAIETVKLIMGIGRSLQGRLLLFDALEMSFREVRIRRDPECPVCGDHPTLHELIDYEEFCGMPHRESSVEAPVAVGV
ncbi:MAG: molybdopterin-synthase adenylyltransferase MoeB [Chloroflexota bacterium]|nr:molybdopterin-synthase adenylyltransferase MoeB [Chloroflexota bacterium]